MKNLSKFRIRFFGVHADIDISTILRAGMELSCFLPESGAIGVLGRGPVTEFVLES
jgi:hypothetical protein